MSFDPVYKRLRRGPSRSRRRGRRYRRGGDECSIAKPRRRAYVDTVEQRACLLGGKNGGFAFLDDVARPANRARRIHRNNLADDEPVEKHADRGELEFHRGCGNPAAEFLDVGRDVERADGAEIGEPVVLAPGGKGRDRSGVGLPRVRVANV